MPNKIKIMIIEDEDAISNFIATTLKANAYAPLLAKTAGQALSMIPSHCPDLILLDLGLPDMDGIEILKKIREWSAVPVIVVSARGEESDKVEALVWAQMIIFPSPSAHLSCWRVSVPPCVTVQKQRRCSK